MRLFTVEEANEALNAVRPLAAELVEAVVELRRLRTEAASLGAARAGNGAGRVRAAALQAAEREAAELALRASQIVAEIEAHGALVKDAEVGLVDFPASSGGATVLLCWRVGEEEIAFWHGLDEGYAGRKPLPL